MKLRRLLLLLCIPTLAVAQQSYYGTTATSVRLSENADPSDFDLIPIHAGDAITPENVRAGIQALFDTGRYRSVDVDAVPADNGTRLTFNVTLYYFFSTFTLEPENLLDRPLSTLLRLPVGQKFSEARVQEIIEETRKFLQDAGYFAATLTSIPGPDNPDRLRTIELHADVKPKATIDAVEIQGGENIFPLSELRKTFHVSHGDVYSAADIDKGISALKDKFLDRNVLNTQIDTNREYDPKTNTVSLKMTISPGQQTIIDTGHEIPDDEIRDLVPIFEEGSLDPDLIREGRARIIEYLQQKGYFEATVGDPQVIPASAGNPARVIFPINKGERHTVRSVQFRGNTVFTDDQIQERLKVHPASFPRILNHGVFSDSLANSDVATIQNMYRRAGFEAAFVEVHYEDDPTSHEIDVVFDITENNRYPIERLVFTGNKNISDAELREAINLKEGDFYAPAQAEDARTALTALYYSMGYPDATVEAAADRNPLTGGRILTYQISEGRTYRIGKILVAGKTNSPKEAVRLEKVVKRNSGLKEYSFYNPEDILVAQQKLYATGLFRHVDIVPLDQDNGELRTVLIQVEEAKHILVTPGVGVKEYTGPRVTLDISHNNLFGLNRSAALRFRVGVREQQFQSTYREPRLFNHDDLDGYGTLTIERRNRPRYQTSSVELALQVRKQLSPTRDLLTTASYQTVILEDIKLSDVVLSAVEPQGTIQIARLNTRFDSDTRDDILDPKRGVFSTTTFQIASRAWGSEVNFVSVFHQSSFFRRSGAGTLAFSSRIGWAIPYGQSKEVPITERYFAGGSTTLRGFGLDEAGPPAGGQLLTIGNVEYRVPLKALSIGELGGVLFYDTGNVFERPAAFSLTDFTHSAGVGLRFQTPLGPVRFDVGFNLHPKTRLQADGQLKREERVHTFFTLGHTF